ILQQLLARDSVRRDLGEPDGCLNGFDLAKERPDAAERVVAPVLEEPRRLRRDLPLGEREVAPRVHLAANLVDDRRQVVRLRLRREAEALVEDQFLLLFLTSPLLGLRNRSYEFSPTTLVDQVSGRLTRRIEFPVLAGVLVRRVD